MCMLCAKLFQLNPTFWNPVDCHPPDSSVQGIFQAGILEWVAISFSRGSSWPRDRTHVSYISCIDRRIPYHWPHVGSPNSFHYFKSKFHYFKSKFHYLKSKFQEQ